MYFERKRESSPGFSLRALAKRLDVSASFLSRVLNGQKPIPAELLPRLARALDVEPELLAKERAAETPKKANVKVSGAFQDWELAEVEATQILRNWYNLPILELTTLENFDGTAESISKRLKISPTTTEIALRELVGLGLIECTDGRYRKTATKLRFITSKTNNLFRKFHDDMLEQGQVELRNGVTEEEFQRRLMIGITISADPEKVKQAKHKLAEFLYQLANELIESPGTEVYHLSAQLFPLTKPQPDDDAN